MKTMTLKSKKLENIDKISQGYLDFLMSHAPLDPMCDIPDLGSIGINDEDAESMLRGLTDEEIKNCYWNYSIPIYPMTYNNVLTKYIDEEESPRINLSSYPLSNLFDDMKRYFRFSDGNFRPFISDDGKLEKMRILYPHVKDNGKVLRKAMKCFGFIDDKSQSEPKPNTWAILDFVPAFRFGSEIRFGSGISYYNFVHWLPKGRLRKVLFDGLGAETGVNDKEFSDRIYLSPFDNVSELLEIGKETYEEYMRNGGKDDVFIALDIVFYNLDDKVRFFPDYRFSHKIYTMDVIPPSCLSIKKIQKFPIID